MLTARGRAGAVAGWLLVAGGAVALVVQAVVGVRSTLGPHGITYLTEPALRSAPGWLTAVVLFAPLLGFNLVYWSSPPQQRLRHMTGVVTVLVLELLILVAATYWYCGADLNPSAMFDKNATSADTTIAVHFFLAATLGAAAMMRWLGGNSTFDRQSAQYFGADRRTVVTLTPMSVRANALFVLAFAVLLLASLAPLIPSSHRTGYENSDPVAPWPMVYRSDSYFLGAVSFYSFAAAVLLGMSASFLAKKLLYAGPWAARTAASPRKGRPGWWVRLAVRVQHGPFIIGLAVFASILSSPSDYYYGYHLDTALLLFGLVVLAGCAALGVLCLAQVWKARDLRRRTLRLHRAV